MELASTRSRVDGARFINAIIDRHCAIRRLRGAFGYSHHALWCRLSGSGIPVGRVRIACLQLLDQGGRSEGGRVVCEVSLYF